jgi:hypothetical protein
MRAMAWTWIAPRSWYSPTFATCSLTRRLPSAWLIPHHRRQFPGQVGAEPAGLRAGSLWSPVLAPSLYRADPGLSAMPFT